MVTVRWWNGFLEDLPDDQAREAVASGHAWLVSAYETAMVEPVAERAVVVAEQSRPAARKVSKRKGRKR